MPPKSHKLLYVASRGWFRGSEEILGIYTSPVKARERVDQAAGNHNYVTVKVYAQNGGLQRDHENEYVHVLHYRNIVGMF